MPYIKPHLRDPSLNPTTCGELNWHLTDKCLSYFDLEGESYQTYNDIIGALESSKLEFYRRMVVSYEDVKSRENGDVY